MYMMYPMTVSVGIDDVLLGKLSSACSVTDPIMFPYLDKEYGVGSTMHVPFVPEMSALKFSIDGTPVCIKFADVVPPVQIRPFHGDKAFGKDAPKIDLEANSGVSTILSTNNPTSVTVSFGASGLSDASRRTQYLGLTLTGDGGASVRCNADGGYGYSDSCPDPADRMATALDDHFGSAARSSLNYFFVQYEVTIDLFKNGQVYDTVTLPINSLVAIRNDVKSAFGIGGTDTPIWNPSVEPHINNNTVTGGTGYGSPYPGSQSSLQYTSMVTSSWGETFTHTFDIQDGNVGDHIEVEISNKVTFRFPWPNGHYSWINTENLHYYDWPPAFMTQIANGDDFLGPQYNELEFHINVGHGPNDRGVLVGINDGFIVVTQSQ